MIEFVFAESRVVRSPRAFGREESHGWPLQRFHMIAKEVPMSRMIECPHGLAVLSVLSADNRLSFIEPPLPPLPPPTHARRSRGRHMTAAERTGRDRAGAFYNPQPFEKK